MARLRRAGCEAVGLEGVSPALRAWASNFSLRDQRKVTKRKATPANPTATRFPSDKVQGRTDRRRWHIPVPAASAPSSLMALLTLPFPLGGLEGEPRPSPVSLDKQFLFAYMQCSGLIVSHKSRYLPDFLSLKSSVNVNISIKFSMS